MKKFALIGKNIQHSRSPEIYYKLFKDQIQYDLIDCESTRIIPNLNELFKAYSGLNITSPYKNHFFNEVIMTDEVRKIGAINCIKMNSGKFFGTNTDYLAMKELVSALKVKSEFSDVILLGSGVMSKVTALVFSELHWPIKFILSRSTHNFDFLNINDLVSTQSNKRALIINACSRDYVFKGKIPKNSLFWDLNYDFQPHKDYFGKLDIEYVDGFDLLYTQAKYAQIFWSEN